MTDIILRDYQTDLVEAVRASYGAGYRSVCMVASTGFGKTVCFIYITNNATLKGKRTLIIAHRRKLVTQTAEYISSPFSYIMAGREYNPDVLIQVASIQTLVRRLDTLDFTPDFIIADEGHLAASDSYKRVYERFPQARRLIVTATPELFSGRGMREICDSMVVGIGMKELIRRGSLVKTRVIAPPIVDVSGVATVNGDYDAEAVAAIIERPTIHGNILQTYREWALDRVTLAFCNTVAESIRMAALFNANGIAAESLDANSDDDWKEAVLERLEGGDIAVLFNCALYIEGLDIPAINCIIDLAATHRVTRYLQKIGRGTRPADGKVDNLYIDTTGNWLRHGMPAQDRDWTLDGMVRRKKVEEHPDNLTIRQCPACYAVFETAEHCPECGVIIPVKQRKIKTKDGWLTEIEIEEIDLKKRNDKMEEWKAVTMGDWLAIAGKRGYAKGWAYMRYNLKKGKKK
jgi:superfamily II DNA or RNA helicase